MTEAYCFVGQIVFMVGGVLATALLIGLTAISLNYILNKIGNAGKFLWQLAEYMIYRNEFREWVKDKKRVKKAI